MKRTAGLLMTGLGLIALLSGCTSVRMTPRSRRLGHIDGKTTTFRSEDGLVTCKPRHGGGTRIHPPRSRRADFVKHDVGPCTTDIAWMHVDPVVAGKRDPDIGASI